MNDDRVVQIGSQSQVSDPLTELLRERAVELLQAAVNAECAEFLHRHQHEHHGAPFSACRSFARLQGSFIAGGRNERP